MDYRGNISETQIWGRAVFRVKGHLATATFSLKGDSVAVDIVGFSGDILEVWKEVSPTREGLTRLILRARRCNAWFRVLGCAERRYLAAVVRTLDQLRSPLLLQVVGRSVRKLLNAMRGMVGDLAYKMQAIGKPLARSVSLHAQGWGYKSAARWAEDEGFIRFLTILYINGPTILP